jgi:hypothetical protein
LGGQNTVNIFPLIQVVLDELYAQISGAASAKDAAINDRLQDLTKTYSDLTIKRAKAINYTDAARRFAYVYKYVTCHSNLVFTRIEDSKELKALFKNDEVQVACIGGGPGSELLGILKYCAEYGVSPKLKFLLFDGEIAWAETWEDIDDKLKEADEKAPATRTIYEPLDVTKPEQYEHKSKYLKQSDLFVMVYFVSEVFSFMDKAQDYFDHLFSGMKKGALILYIDNKHSSFTTWIDKQLAKHGLAVLAAADGLETMPTDEEKTELGKYYGKFKSDPKLNADIAWRIARKT